jgi:hypothetical protein
MSYRGFTGILYRGFHWVTDYVTSGKESRGNLSLSIRSPLCHVLTVVRSTNQKHARAAAVHDLRQLHLGCAPDVPEVLRMLSELLAVAGNPPALNQLLGLPAVTVENWMAGRKRPTAAGVRAVWLIHALTFHPERLQTLFDVVTWGRYRRSQHHKEKPADAPKFAAPGMVVPDYEI